MAVSQTTYVPSAHYESARRTALRLLAGCSHRRTISPKSLHRLRSTLRRLQAWLEVMGEHQAADRLARRISRTSRLRSLHVFEGWLMRKQAPRSDRRIIAKAVRRECARIADADVFHEMRPTLDAIRDQRPPGRPSQIEDWVDHRRRLLVELLSEVQDHPKRKRFHRLRLQLKLLRYVLEWAAPRSSHHRWLIGRLKHVQRCLGTYEDFAAFRKLAKRWKLTIRRRIEKSWRKARKSARSEARTMDWLEQALARGRSKPEFGGRIRRREQNTRRVNADLTSH